MIKVEIPGGPSLSGFNLSKPADMQGPAVTQQL